METIDTSTFDAMLEEAKWGLMKSKPASYWMQREAFANAILDRAKDRLTLYIDGVVYVPAEGGRRQLVECGCGANYSDCWTECPLCGKRRDL